MRTRQIDYSDEKFMIRQFTKKLGPMIVLHLKIRTRCDHLQTVQSCNRLLTFNLKHFDILNHLQIPKNVLGFEKHYMTISTKLKELKTDMDTLILNYINNPEFIKKSKRFYHLYDVLNHKIHDYFTRKYSAVLLKTNRDIFRNVLSFL